MFYDVYKIMWQRVSEYYFELSGVQFGLKSYTDFQICTSAQWKFHLKSENLIAQKQDLCQWKYLTFAFQKL